ncbi:MAG: Ldh family oxidoreductase [Thaumarchaeota archaeon]|jgi:LDH2 family malate/lactate/ureidoglycolate dehydrogenase|nr:Ldh family oxidoreductase [Candidatus Wolframiiraptor allenii]
MSYVIVFHEDLRRFTRECFLRAGVPEQDADVIADHLVLANLRGVDSHGVIRIPYYLEGVERGYVRPESEFRVLRENPVMALVDGGGGLGIPVAAKATELAIQKARDMGVAVVCVRNLGHIGMLAYYTLKVAEAGMMGLAATNSPARVAPWGGSKPLFGTNPISFSIPSAGKPVIFDMATSKIADFKIRMALMRGDRLQEGVALSLDGRPTTSPEEALRGALLPFGEYKGYAISLMVEALSALLGGALLSVDVVRHASTQGGFFIMALDVSAFRDYAEYLRDLERLMGLIKSCPPAHGFEEILLPGELEERALEKRLRDGIPIDNSTWSMLIEVANRLGVELPRVKS